MAELGGLVFAVLAAALLIGAAILWKARTGRGILLGCLIAVTAVAAGVRAVDVGQRFSTVSAANFNAAKIGMPQAGLEDRLGAPVSTDATATWRPSGATVGCDLYRSRGSAGPGGYVFCFHQGALVEKFAWDAPL